MVTDVSAPLNFGKKIRLPSGDQANRPLAPALPGTVLRAPSDTSTMSTTPSVRAPVVPGAPWKTMATRVPSGETVSDVATSPLGPITTGPGTPLAPSMCTTFRSDHTTLSWFAIGSASEYSCAPNVARTLCCAGLHNSSSCAGGDPSSTRLGPACPTTPAPRGSATVGATGRSYLLTSVAA